MFCSADAKQIFPLLPTRGLIAVDGIERSGKSSLARTIADEVGAAWFELDAYIPQKMAGLRDYPQSLCYDYLNKDISEVESPLIIVDGIFLRDVLNQAKQIWNFYIYCRKVEIHRHGKKATDIFEPWDYFPNTIAYRNYFSRHNLPLSADLLYTWETEAE